MKSVFHRARAFTIVELLCSAAVTSIILGGVAVGAIALRRSYIANRTYIRDNANSTRLIDYVTQDLRNAVGVSVITSSGTTVLKVSSGVEIDGSTQLSVSVPSFYQSNIPDNNTGSTYKTGVYNRSMIPSGQTYFGYDVVTDKDSFPRTLKFLGSIEVRYSKKARSASDATLCYFRQEYEGGVLRREDEIAEFGATEKLKIIAIDPRDFQVSTSFASRTTGELYRDGTRQSSTVSIVNSRKDL